MNHPTLARVSLMLVGVFALVMINSVPVVHAQSIFSVPPPSTFAQPCVNNGSNVLGKDTGK
jgi:hypothetical protein